MRHVFVALAVTTIGLTSAVDAQPGSDTGVQAVLAAASGALGAQNIKNLPSFHATATGSSAGLPVTSESYTELSGGGAFADYTHLEFFTQDTGYDGRAAWTRDSKGVVWVDGSQQGHAAAINEAFREAYALWSPSHGGASVSLLPSQSAGGRSYDIVHVTAPDSVVPFDVWIDRTTHLPTRYVETAAAVTTTTLLTDYRPVAGVQIPFGFHQASNQGNKTDLTVTHVDVAPAGIDDKLRKPETDVHDFSISGGTQTSIPFELIDNHVYLRVMLNGKGPFRFLFDTGGSNVVDPAVAKQIGATAAGSVQGGGVGAATEEVAFATVASLRVGDAELTDQLFSVLPVHAGFGMSSSAPADGLIGAEVLARFVTVFDYAQKQVILKLPGAVPAGTSIPFVFAGTQPQVPCTIDSIAAQCTIDSGSRSSLDLFAPFIAENPTVLPANAAATGLNGFGVGGGDVGRLGRLPSLGLGGFDLKNLVAGFSEARAGAFAVPGIAANIGGGVLKRFTVTFDYPHQTMSLQPNVGFDVADQYEHSGMFVINEGKFVVASVRAGTPAAQAGIVKGDVIASVNGVQSAQLTLGAIRETFRRPAGTQLQIGVLSKGASEPHTITLTLRAYV